MGKSWKMHLKFLGRKQTIRITVMDVYEPPKFINQPRPYLGIVPPKAPIGFQVYKVWLM